MKVRELIERSIRPGDPARRRPPYSSSQDFRGGNTKIDQTGDWWVVDRDTGQRYANGLSTRAAAEDWCLTRNIPCLNAEEGWRVASADPIAAAYCREHPNIVIATRIAGV